MQPPDGRYGANTALVAAGLANSGSGHRHDRLCRAVPATSWVAHASCAVELHTPHSRACESRYFAPQPFGTSPANAALEARVEALHPASGVTLIEERAVTSVLPEVGERHQQEGAGSDRAGRHVDDDSLARAQMDPHVDNCSVLEVQFPATQLKAGARHRQGSLNAAVGDYHDATVDRGHAAPARFGGIRVDNLGGVCYRQAPTRNVECTAGSCSARDGDGARPSDGRRTSAHVQCTSNTSAAQRLENRAAVRHEQTAAGNTHSTSKCDGVPRVDHTVIEDHGAP
eukprot:187912-Prymnesium_polylepis.2